jgi:phosphoserine phosphatase RsbU/P
VDRLLRLRHVLPLIVLAGFAALDLANGRDQASLGTVVTAPVLAATFLGRRATAAYGVLAFVVAVLLGAYDRQYASGPLLAQVTRLFGVAVGGALAVVASALRQRRERQLARVARQAAEARGAVELAERLQRTLLSDPPPVAGLELAVRYLPAVRGTQVGGDWYDAFPLPCGATVLVIGDVTGHDVAAAASMAEARGVLRGIAQTVEASPAAVLSALDRALANLGELTPVTAVIGIVHPRADGTTLLRWSNAGHPPPVLLAAGGAVEVLAREPDLLLGVDPTAARADHERALAPGDTLLLYTDGLIERRGVPLDDGTAWLAGTLGGLADRPLEALCDALLAGMAAGPADDVAVLAARVDG